MKVGFGVTVLARGLQTKSTDGIGRYTHELYKGLCCIPSLELNPYSFNFPILESVLKQPIHLYGRFHRELIKAALWSGTRIGPAVGGRPIDLLHAGDHIVPLVKGVPLLSTVMDAIPISNPEWVNQTTTGRLKIRLWRGLVKRSDHILTISEYSKSEIVKYFDIEPSRISTVPLGVDKEFFQTASELDKKRVCAKYDIDKPYFVFVGTLQPRKNIARLLEAMQLLPEHIKKSHNLVIVGRDGWGNDDLVTAIRKAEREGWCKWIGWLPDHELRALLQSAALFVFPSLSEGFGLPVLEAFASKVPVVASNITSIPEVCGDAATLVDPLDPSDIALAMSKIVENNALGEEMIQKGHKRAMDMSWKKCAEDTFSIYKQVVQNYR